MSRIGRQPISLPDGVTATARARLVTIKGPKGELQLQIHPAIAVAVEGNQIVCSVPRANKETPALWGTTRARLANMVTGVTSGFTKELELQGVGFRAQLKGKDLELSLGFSHPVVVSPPAGISFAVAKEKITVSGSDIVQVGQVAADVRALRKPEPYKGKGIRYVGEHVRRKVGKVVGTTTE